jgi:hypothetical protein
VFWVVVSNRPAAHAVSAVDAVNGLVCVKLPADGVCP